MSRGSGHLATKALSSQGPLLQRCPAKKDSMAVCSNTHMVGYINPEKDQRPHTTPDQRYFWDRIRPPPSPRLVPSRLVNPLFTKSCTRRR